MLNKFPVSLCKNGDIIVLWTYRDWKVSGEWWIVSTLNTPKSAYKIVCVYQIVVISEEIALVVEKATNVEKADQGGKIICKI